MDEIFTTFPPRVRDRLYHALGAMVLPVNKLRYALLGYRRARDFSPADIARCVDYDFRVVENWKAYLGDYLGGAVEVGREEHSRIGARAGPGDRVDFTGWRSMQIYCRRCE